MRILVTGGAGFIGSNVVDTYIAGGHEVFVVDNLSTGKRENLNPQAQFFPLDVRGEALEGIFREHKFDLVNHHAAQIDVRRSIQDPAFDAGINILGGLALLKLCHQYGVQKVVYASTGGALYGEPGLEALPADEDTPIRPISAYGISKYALEHYLRLYRELHQLDFTVLRYANVYGPRQDPLGEAGVVAIFTNQLLRGAAPIIFGDGLQTRDYVFVGDVCQANLAALQRGSGTVSNVATGVQTNVLELLSLLQQALGRSGDPIFEAARGGEVRHISLDPGRAQAALGWEPTTALSLGLQKTAAFYQAATPRS